MCLACGSGWPWGRAIYTAPPPTKEEYIFVDSNTGWYPDYRQGIHPPGPVYQSTQPTPSAQPAQPAVYYYSPTQQPQPPPAQYGSNCYYYAPSGWPITSTQSSPSYYTPRPFSSPTYYPAPKCHESSYSPYTYHVAVPAPGQPMMLPNPMCQGSLVSQAAAAAAANAALAASPNAPSYYVGINPTDYATQSNIIALNMGFPQQTQQQQPTSLAPYKPSDGQQFWCREMDGSWTLKGYSEIALGEVSPGHWERHSVSGYYYWVRTAT